MKYYDLERYVDYDKFVELQEEIHTLLSDLNPTYKIRNIVSNNSPVKLLPQAYKEFYELDDNDPVKVEGLKLNSSDFVTYLKISMQAYDPYSYFDGRLFPQTNEWVNSLSIFKEVHKATFIVTNYNGITVEHKDLDLARDFVYIRPNLEKPLYLCDNNTRTYINSKVAHWDHNCFFGGDKIIKQHYMLLIEGVFTEEINNEIRG